MSCAARCRAAGVVLWLLSLVVSASRPSVAAVAPAVAAAGASQPAESGFSRGAGNAGELLRWVRAHGGEVHLEVAQVCPGCLQGVLATKDIKRGERIASIPLSTVTDLGPHEVTLPELAVHWVRRMHLDASYNVSFQPYLATLPAADQVLSPEMWTDDMVAALQSLELAEMVGKRRRAAEQMWRQAGFAGGHPTGGEGTSIRLPLADFQHLIACVATRMFGYPSMADNATMHAVLLPVLDMANCADKGLAGPSDPGANGEVRFPQPGEDSFTMVALRDISKGEEVTNTYSHDYVHRPDMALLSYGFVPNRQPPILSAIDLPEGFGDVEHPVAHLVRTPAVEPGYGNWTGQFTTEKELQRLLSIQAALPTTLEEDLQLLAEAQQPGCRVVLDWRVSRKRALLAAIAQLSASLAARQKVWPRNCNFRQPAPGGISTSICGGGGAYRRDVGGGSSAAADSSEWYSAERAGLAASIEGEAFPDEQGEAPQYTAEELAFAEAYWDEIDQLNREVASGSTRSRGSGGSDGGSSGSGGSRDTVHGHQSDEL